MSKGTEQPSGDTVVVKKSELEEIIKLNRELLARNSGAPAEKPREIKDRMVTVFFIDNEPVMGYMNRGSASRPIYVYEKPDINRPGEYIPFIDVVTRGRNDKPYQLNYNDFMKECDRKDCLVKSIHWDEWVIDQGQTTGRTYEEGSYNMLETGTIVPVEVKGKTAIFTVQLPDGTEADIHERYVNINK